MDLNKLPDDNLERLKQYRQAMAEDEEYREVQRIKFKANLGEKLTTGEANTLAYSRYGTAPACHHQH